MAESAYAEHLKCSDFGRKGSSPFLDTIRGVVIFIAMPTDEEIMQTYEETGSIVETARMLQVNVLILLRRIKQIQQENQPA